MAEDGKAVNLKELRVTIPRGKAPATPRRASAGDSQTARWTPEQRRAQGERVKRPAARRFSWPAEKLAEKLAALKAKS